MTTRRWHALEEAGIVDLCQTLIALEVCRVTIERPDGVLVERLLAAGLSVLAIHPRAARARFSGAGGKSDRFDAFVLCELARADSHRFRALALDADDTQALRALTRARDELVDARTALCNQLRAQLLAFWPGATMIFADLDSPIALAFVQRYPSPADARGLGPQRLRAFLDRHAYCGRQTPEKLRAGCGPRRPAAPVSSRPTRAAPPCSDSSPRCSRSSSRSASSPARSTAPSAPTPTGRSSCPCSATRRPRSAPPP